MLNHFPCNSIFVINALKAVITYILFLETNSSFLEGQRKLILKLLDKCIPCVEYKNILNISEYRTKNQHASEAQIWANVRVTGIARLHNFSSSVLSLIKALKGF